MKKYLLLLVLGYSITFIKAQPRITENEKQDWVSYLFQNYMGEKPSASFVVIKDGEVQDCQSFGYADLENKVLANCETNYRLGSVTKQFTAMGALILINQGKLNYNTKLIEIIPEFPEYGKDITVQNLMSHRSGLESYNKLNPEDSKKQLLDKDVLNLLIEHDSLLFAANSKYKYSNSGYAVLAMIIERVSGKSFKEFMDIEIFEKTGMVNSTVYLNDLKIKNRAQGYKFNDSIYENKDQNTWSAIQGDGGIYSSVSDYVHWDRSLYDETLIKTELRNDAFSNWDENGKSDKKGYGFGWFIENKDGTKYLVHGGSTTGFRTFVLRIPSKKIAIAIYTNTSGSGYRSIAKKGYALASLYSDNEVLMPMDIALEREISKNGSKSISENYKRLSTVRNKYDINEKDIITLGFSYFKNEPEKSQKVFELITTEFPNYFGGYYGLGQYYAYKTEDNNKLAIENYKKVVELNPSNEQRLVNRSKKMIEKLSE